MYGYLKIQMKNKPVNEGYNFWEICCISTGFVLQRTPDCMSCKSTQRRGEFIDRTPILFESLPNRNINYYVVGMDNFLTFPQMFIGAR